MGDILSDFMLTQEVPVAWKVLRGDCSCRIQGEEFRVRLDSGEGTRFWQTDRILGEQIGSSRDLKGLVASAVRYLGQDCFGARTTGQHALQASTDDADSNPHHLGFTHVDGGH